MDAAPLEDGSLLVVKTHQLVQLTASGATVLKDFESPVAPLLWNRSDGEFCVYSNSSPATGRSDSLFCMKKGRLTSYASKHSLKMNVPCPFPPVVWSGRTWWLMCPSYQSGAPSCKVQSTLDGISWMEEMDSPYGISSVCPVVNPGNQFVPVDTVLHIVTHDAFHELTIISINASGHVI
jgi:hypothetical protein